MYLSWRRRLLFVSVCVLLLFSLSESTLSKKDKKKKQKEKEEWKALTTVTERGLVTKSPKWKEIVKNHDLYSSEHNTVKNFAGMSLGYVTPWNNHGYDTAKWFGAKFTYISPVWLQIRNFMKT